MRISRIAFALVPCLLCASCGLLPVEEELLTAPVLRSYETKEYTTFRAARGDVEQYASIGVNYIPTYTETLSFQESGILYQEVAVSVGDAVAAGDVVATLEYEALDESIRDFTYKLRQNEAELATAKADYEERATRKMLASEREALALDYGATRTRLESEGEILRLQLALVEEQRARRILTAGMSGVVTYVRKIKDGDVSVQKESVVTITDKSHSVFSHTGKDYEYLEPGLEVIVTCNKEDYPARVVTAAALGIEGKEQTAYMELLEPTMAIKDKATGTVRLLIDAARDVVYVPADAIHTVRDETFVYLFEDDIRVTRNVVTGIATKEAVEIVEGLREGEEVITEGIR